MESEHDDSDDIIDDSPDNEDVIECWLIANELVRHGYAEFIREDPDRLLIFYPSLPPEMERGVIWALEWLHQNPDPWLDYEPPDDEDDSEYVPNNRKRALASQKWLKMLASRIHDRRYGVQRSYGACYGRISKHGTSLKGRRGRSKRSEQSRLRKGIYVGYGP